MRVTVILPLLDEEAFAHIALDSLNDQTIPFELIVIVDERTIDRSAEIARRYTPLVITSPAGKLTAKQLGVAEASSDIIITVDADCFYPKDYLELMTRHFRDPNVVLVAATHYSHDLSSLSQIWRQFSTRLGTAFLKYAAGCVQAFRKTAFLAVGGYDLVIDQFDWRAMVSEEEFKFPYRLAQIGKIIYEEETYAVMFNRRGMCAQCPNFGENQICQYCQQISSGERF